MCTGMISKSMKEESPNVMSFNILLVDDHKIITDSFQKLLFTKFGDKISVIAVNTLQEGYQQIFEKKRKGYFDVVSLDISMPAYVEKNINDGVDFGKLIRKSDPDIKIIIISGHYNIAQVNEIIKYVDPVIFTAKSDLDGDLFLNIFEKVFNNSSFKSKEIKRTLKGSTDLNTQNLNIIVLLSQGAKSKKIQEKLKMSRSTLQKRKVQIKTIFNIEAGNDDAIIAEARKRNLI